MTEQTDTQGHVPTVPKGYMEDANGSLVPITKIAAVDLERDRLVKELVAAASTVSGEIAAFKRQAMLGIQTFVEQSVAQYGVQLRGAAGKGNVTLTSFDGRFKVQRSVSERVAFDERLQGAKAAIDNCLRKWSKGANANLKGVVERTFKTDKAGQLSVAKILDLSRIEIDDADWKAAMQMLKDSMHAVSSVAYVRFYARNDETGEYVAIPLDAAAV